MFYQSMHPLTIISFDLKYTCRNPENIWCVGLDLSQIEYIRELARNNDLSYIAKLSEIEASVEELRSRIKRILKWKKLSAENIAQCSKIFEEFKHNWNNLLDIQVIEESTKYELIVKDKFDLINFGMTF